MLSRTDTRVPSTTLSRSGGKSEPETPHQWVAVAFYLSLETAMRRGEILSLCWADIFFEERYAHLARTKNGDERDVPLSKAAIALLNIIKEKPRGQPIVPVQPGYFSALFHKAKREVGLNHIRFNDSSDRKSTRLNSST